MDHDKRSERRGAKWLLVVAAALVALVAAASAQGKSTNASADPVTLKVFDANNDPGPNAEQIELIKRFEAANPGVTIKRTSVPFNNFLNTVKLNLSSSDAPDVSDGNQGPQIDGALVKGKLITPLTDYAKKFGWNKLWTPTTLRPTRSRPTARSSAPARSGAFRRAPRSSVSITTRRSLRHSAWACPRRSPTSRRSSPRRRPRASRRS